MVQLHKLKPGQRGRICRVQGHPRAIRRLAEFGLRPGVEVEMLRPGPVSIIRMNGSRLCLRGSHQLTVLVEPVGDGAPCLAQSDTKHLPSRAAQDLDKGCAVEAKALPDETVTTGVSTPASGCHSPGRRGFRWRFGWTRRK